MLYFYTFFVYINSWFTRTSYRTFIHILLLISILSLVFIAFYFIRNKRFNWEHFVTFSIFIKLFYLSIIYFNSFSILYFILSTDLSTLSTFFSQVINIVIHIINLVFSRLWGTYQLIHSPYYYYYGYLILYILYKASPTQTKNKIFSINFDKPKNV